MLEKFYYEIESNSNDVNITTYNLLYEGPEYMEESIVLSCYSIQVFLEALLDPAYIPRQVATVVKTEYDYIKIYYGGADDNPVVQFFNDREEFTGNEDDCSGPVAIPIDVWGKENYKYITPLIEDLKKYIPH